MTHGSKSLWRVNRSLVRVGQGSSRLRAGENFEPFSDREKGLKNEMGVGRINPDQPQPNGEFPKSQKTPNGSTGGSTASCPSEVIPKTGQNTPNSATTLTNVSKTDEREAFTL